MNVAIAIGDHDDRHIKLSTQQPAAKKLIRETELRQQEH
jgi:hypothetical protein